MAEMTITILVPLFFLTALIYSMVGFGGGSTYLALLALAGVSYTMMPMTSLLCNIVVVTGSCLIFFRAQLFDLKLVIPFLAGSVPFAYIGGGIPIEKNSFLLLLGLTLLVAAIRLFLVENKFDDSGRVAWKKAMAVGVPVGAVLGLVSGLTGIGGGIFLSPILYLLRWGSAKKVASASAFFILVNSVSGLLGQLIKNSFGVDWGTLLPLLIAVFIGGQLGCQLCIGKLSRLTVQRLTAVLILSVSVRILWQTFL